MSKGTVKFFNSAKGYGFIKMEDETEIFVHFTAIAGEGYKTLNEGDSVECDVVEGEKGKQAQNVVKV